MSHYNISSESEQHISIERHKLIKLFYKNEMSLKFETLSTKLKYTFATMEKYGESRSKREKFSTFLDNIRTINQTLEYKITFCRSNNNEN